MTVKSRDGVSFKEIYDRQNLLLQQILNGDVSFLQIEIPNVSRRNYRRFELRQIPG